jgi:hypothetical protein
LTRTARAGSVLRGACRLLLLPLLAAPALGVAQDFEPRRWTHLPVGTDVLGLAYAFTKGEVGFDPVLAIEDAEVELHTATLGYTRYFALAQRTARIDVILPAQSGRWDGLLDGVPAAVDRDGPADPIVRLSVLLSGAPARSAADFVDYRRRNAVQTSVGAGLELRLPLGEYQEDKLINLGQNRFVLAPQLGVLHTRGEWSCELTGSMFLYSDNEEFFGGNELEQDPLFLVQAHAVKVFGPSWWLSFGAAYGWAGESTINGAAKDDERSNLLFGPSIGCRLSATQSLRLGYIRTDTLTDVGSDTHNLGVGWSVRF